MSKVTKKAVTNLMDIYNKNVVDPFILKLQNPQDKSVVMEVSVKTSMTIGEKSRFVDRVVNACFDENGDYMPWYLDPVFIITLLQMTTNVPVYETKVSLNDETEINTVDIERTYELCKAIDLVHNVKQSIYQNLVGELRQMVSDKLEYRKQMQLSRERQLLNKAREEVENGVAMIVAVADQLNKTLENASSANDMAEALKNMNYTEMVNAVLKQA